MIKVTLDKATLAKLHNLSERVEVCDESGRVVGYAHPAKHTLPPEYEEPPITKEEIDRLVNEPGGRSLAEILADLRSKS
jgi:hypothetical protein